MKFFFLLFIFFSKAYALELQVGDVLLQPLNCRLCTLIEDEEQTIFSHMGIVVQTQPEVLIAESWFTVKTQTFDEFNQKTQKDQALQVIRLRDSSMAIDPVAFLELFQRKYAGKKYDHHFLWDNYDENGDEMLYCSEFVGKFLTEYFGIDFPIKQMHFSRNLEAWKKHFRGEVPVGKWGNSPGDFERSPLFIHVQ